MYIYIPLYVGYKTRYTCAIVFSLVIFNLSAAIYQLLLPSLLFTCSGEAKKIIIVDLWQRKAFALPLSLPLSLYQFLLFNVRYMISICSYLDSDLSLTLPRIKQVKKECRGAGGGKVKRKTRYCLLLNPG